MCEWRDPAVPGYRCAVPAEPGSEFCIFHDPNEAKDKDKFAKLLIQQLNQREPSRFQNPRFSFVGYVFPVSLGAGKWASISEIVLPEKFVEETHFEKAVFRARFFISNVVFEKRATFDNAVFNCDCRFQACRFEQGASFLGTRFEGATNFWGTLFKGGCNFGSAKFAKKASFFKCHFHNRTNFSNVRFIRSANFQHARFQTGPNFVGCRFRRESDFSWCKFTGEAFFQAAFFKGGTSFHKASFHKGAVFAGVRFKGGAIFSGAAFKENASFVNTEFSPCTKYRGDRVPNYQRLTGDASFDNTIFERHAFFPGAVFDAAANFFEAQFRGRADFRNAVFKGKTDFTLASCAAIQLGEGKPTIKWLPRNLRTLPERCGVALHDFTSAKSFWNFAVDGFQRAGMRERADAAYYFLRLFKMSPYRNWKRFVWWLADCVFLRWTVAYGASFSRLVGTWWFIVLLFAFLYRYLPCAEVQLFDMGSPGLKEWPLSFGRALYFSLITFTTLGYGDIRPAPGLGSALTAIEASLGGVIMALTVLMIGRKFMR